MPVLEIERKVLKGVGMENEKKRNTTVLVAGVGIATVGLIGGVGYLAYIMKKKGVPERFTPKKPTLGERDPSTGLHNFGKPNMKDRLMSVIE